MSRKKNGKTQQLQEFLPALLPLATAAAPHIAGALGGALATKGLKKLTGGGANEDVDLGEDLEEVDLKEDDLKEDDDVSEAYLSMLESQLEEEGALDEFIGDVVGWGAKKVGQLATLPARTATKVVGGFGKGLLGGEGKDYEDEYGDEYEDVEETYPAQSHYPSPEKPKYPRHKNAMRDEGTKVRDEQSMNRNASGPAMEGMFDEETYPHQTEYPQDKPNFPRIVHVKRGGVSESYILAPIIQEQGMAGMAKQLWPQLLQIIAALPPELLAKIPALISTTISGKQAAGGAAGAAMGEALTEQQPGTTSPEAQKAEQERQKWLQDFLAQKPASVTDQEANAIGSQIMQQLSQGAVPQAPQAPQVPGQPTSLPQVQGELGRMQRTGLPTMRGEGKKLVMTKGQLKEALKESILLHEKKKLVDKIVRKQIREQVKTRKLCANLLEAGPLSGLWQKTGGKLFGGGAAQAGALPTDAHQASVQGAVQDQAKQGQKMVAQAMKAVEKTKGKFNQETLKSASLINQYHDAVLNLVNLMGQAKGTLAPMELQQLQSQVNQSVGQLQYDLESERSGIDTFLDSLSKNVPGATGKTEPGQGYTPPSPGDMPSAQQLGQQAKSAAEKERAAEFSGKGTKIGRLARSPGLRRETKGKGKKSSTK